MAEDIVQKIKKVAHDVSEGFLLFGKDMNEAIIQKFNDGDLDNTEMLKRACEQANQNVYLAKFSKEEDKGNISFPIADFNLVKENIDESERSMELYDAPPEDFRSALEMVVDNMAAAADQEKTASLEKLSRDDLFQAKSFRDKFARLVSAAEMMKTAAMEEFESSFNLIYHNAKKIVANGDSIGDMAKIASRSVIEDDMNPSGVMKAYGIIEKELTDSGFSVRNEFTKISSLKINHNSLQLRPAKEMTMAIEKIAAFEEMEENLQKVVNAIDNVIKENMV